MAALEDGGDIGFFETGDFVPARAADGVDLDKVAILSVCIMLIIILLY
jgi:hypothetical protein